MAKTTSSRPTFDPSKVFVVLKNMTFDGHPFKPGEPFEKALSSERKLRQLYDARYLRFATPEEAALYSSSSDDEELTPQDVERFNGDPDAAIEIPVDWKSLHFFRRRTIAKAITPGIPTNADKHYVDDVIARELERRAGAKRQQAA